MPKDPVELARERAQDASYGFEMTSADLHALAELEAGAEMLGFLHQRYFVEANRGMIFPQTLEREAQVSYTSLPDGVTFEGTLFTYSKVHIGQIIGRGAVRALCLTFEDVILLPYFDKIDDDKLLHVPVLAVNTASQTS